MPPAGKKLTVAVTGPTGTFGFGLIPLLEESEGIGRIIGMARRPFDPSEHGWTKMEYRQGDVREPQALEEAFRGADVVVHLAFLITGGASRETIRAINVEGTLNTFRAAAEVGARSFVYASSVAAYGFHRDNPIGMTEEWPARPADRLFYAQEKAEIEGILGDAAKAHPELGLYLLRPPIVLGPHAVGAKSILPGGLDRFAAPIAGAVTKNRLPLPLPAPTLPLQFIHEEDVGLAFLQCILGVGPPGTYNIAGDGVMTAAEVVGEMGFIPIPVPGGPIAGAARAISRLPALPPAAEWVEAISHPAIMDTSKAKKKLKWRPRYTGAEALRDTLRS
jgi:nucleoside-diphosphate-sugar epimerase